MKTFNILACIVALLALELPAARSDAPLRKQLGGPPSEFRKHVLPSPISNGIEQKSVLIKAPLTASATGALSASVKLPVDSEEHFAFTFYSDLADSLTLTLLSPTGAEVDIALHQTKTGFPLSDDGSATMPAIAFQFTRPLITVGDYTLKVVSKPDADPAVLAAGTHVFVVNLFNFDGVQVFTYLSSYSSSAVGQPIGLVTRVTLQTNHTSGFGAPPPLQNSVTSALMDVTLPDGTTDSVKMHDDGLHNDLMPNDGVYGATLTARQPGAYVATAFVEGKFNGRPFARSTTQLIAVHNDTLRLTGTASSTADGAQRLTINIGVSQQTTNTYRAYAEVWGVDSANNAVAVAWIGGIVNTVASNGQDVVQLALDLQWLARANASAPLTLRNVVLQDLKTYMPVAQADSIPVTARLSLGIIQRALHLLKQRPNVSTEITEAMRWGVRPAKYAHRKLVGAGPIPLLVTHGYCASDNPWQGHSDYADAYFFVDKDASRSTDDFAQMLYAFSESNKLTAFSALGHSQGGLALLHMHNYYWTGLETPISKGRLIQTLGSPFMGSTAAGSAATLGSIFGIGCGKNIDLSPDGAKLWYAGISAAAEDDVFFYTTTYKQDKFLGDSCNLAMNLVLDWPNDGVTELARAQLPNGNQMGNTEAQCHTTGMKYEAQYYDAARNKVFDAERPR
eukprot:TRINITY_DN27396_c0_g1_i1.p1 TRINITY_DN27396_c0_g1~~TRINITY_DN27396_c0_g1_i1.p1  ORF type:complete len:678 (-),score=219.27 TRINITY_DN27396_c0_g1_i1:561-2594(-)